MKKKQVIRETAQSVTKTLDLIIKLAEGFDRGFHAIFPPEELPISFNRPARRKP